jgi:hypothetical protein
MKDKETELTDDKPREGYTDTISFREFIKELTGVSCEEFYKDYLDHGDNDE